MTPGYEKMTRLDFIAWFLGQQSKEWLIHELLKIWSQENPTVLGDMAEKCFIQLVNQEK